MMKISTRVAFVTFALACSWLPVQAADRHFALSGGVQETVVRLWYFTDYYGALKGPIKKIEERERFAANPDDDGIYSESYLPDGRLEAVTLSYESAPGVVAQEQFAFKWSEDDTVRMTLSQRSGNEEPWVVQQHYRFSMNADKNYGKLELTAADDGGEDAEESGSSADMHWFYEQETGVIRSLSTGRGSAKQTFTLGGDGQLLRFTQLHGGEIKDYIYDYNAQGFRANRLTASSLVVGSYSYEYDQAGNWIEQRYTPDGAEQPELIRTRSITYYQ